MEDQIQELMERYGVNHDYHTLSEQQKLFLLDHAIKDNTDTTGEKTVKVKGIKTIENGTLLDILDVRYYLFRKNSAAGSGQVYDHAMGRISMCKKALEVTSDPIKSRGSQTYLFELPDHCKVRVEYDTLKDKP